MPQRADRDLLVLAELNPDVIVACPSDAVRFGQVEQLVGDATVTLGSSGAITASAAAAQGLRVGLVAVVGDDAAGALVVDLLARQGVDVAGVIRRRGARTGMTVVLSAPGGDRALLTFPGTMGDLRPTDLPQDLLSSTRHLHVSSFYLQRSLQPALPALFASARDAGVPTSLDPGWDPAERWAPIAPALRAVAYLLPNAAECRAIAAAVGPDGGDGASALEGALALHSLGPSVALKRGGEGASLAAGGVVVDVAATPAAPLDTTGAGDCFDAGLIAALLEGASPGEALRRAVATGAISVGGVGGVGRLPARDEVLAAARSLRARPSPSAPAPRGGAPIEEPV